jgi:hypothetical protein
MKQPLFTAAVLAAALAGTPTASHAGFPPEGHLNSTHTSEQAA